MKGIRGKAIAIQVYAWQTQNVEMEREACDIRLRAERKLGHLISELDQSQSCKRVILITVEIVRRQPGQVGFAVLPRRGVVKRTFAWLGRAAYSQARSFCVGSEMDKAPSRSAGGNAPGPASAPDAPSGSGAPGAGRSRVPHNRGGSASGCKVAYAGS